MSNPIYGTDFTYIQERLEEFTQAMKHSKQKYSFNCAKHIARPGNANGGMNAKRGVMKYSRKRKLYKLLT
jgi:hypothetical protein